MCQVLGENPTDPRPAHSPPLVQAILILLYFPTAWVATLHQVVGSKVHAVDLSDQGLHFLVQDVEPDMDGKHGSSEWQQKLVPVSRCVALAPSLHILSVLSRRGRKGGRQASKVWVR